MGSAATDRAGDLALRHVGVPDLAAILAELEDFWGAERDMGFLHQALYVHEFGETSVLAERDGWIAGYLLGFAGQDGTGYIHAVAVREEARGGGLGRRMYERFGELVAEREANRLKAITAPENAASRAFHEALGFDVEEVAGYSPSAGARLVFTKPLGEPVAGAEGEADLGDGVILRPLRLEDSEELHAAIEANREHVGRWLTFPGEPYERSAAHVRRSVRESQAGRGLSMVVVDRGRLIGAVSLVDPSREHGFTSIGYWLAADAQGRGIMTRAVAVLAERALDLYGFGRVEIRVAAANERSRAIPERLGFRREGSLRAGHRIDGVAHEELVYGLLAEDPRPWDPGGRGARG